MNIKGYSDFGNNLSNYKGEYFGLKEKNTYLDKTTKAHFKYEELYYLLSRIKEFQDEELKNEELKNKQIKKGDFIYNGKMVNRNYNESAQIVKKELKEDYSPEKPVLPKNEIEINPYKIYLPVVKTKIVYCNANSGQKESENLSSIKIRRVSPENRRIKEKSPFRRDAKAISSKCDLYVDKNCNINNDINEYI